MFIKMKNVYRRILDFYPDNKEARRILGYYKYKGKWYFASELRKKGLVFKSGKWCDKVKPKSKQDKLGLSTSSASKSYTLTQKPKKTKEHCLSLTYKKIKIITPPGDWEKSSIPVIPLSRRFRST